MDATGRLPRLRTASAHQATPAAQHGRARAPISAPQKSGVAVYTVSGRAAPRRLVSLCYSHRSPCSASAAGGEVARFCICSQPHTISPPQSTLLHNERISTQSDATHNI